MAAQKGPGAISAERRAAAKDLIRKGVPYSEVQRQTGVSVGTCSNIRRELEAEGDGAVAMLPTSATRKGPRVEASASSTPPAAARGASPPMAEPDGPPSSNGAAGRPRPPPASAAGGLGDDFAALEEQERDVVALLDVARANENYQAMERLTRMRIELRRAMAQLRPPPPVDPEADVANVEAAQVLVARIRKMVRAKQERAGT
ncbi:hypothetical protein [Sorangium sp. So ce1000]|uniref:hypothetical protein n=1 Tax=Sorangium sp. So ce1000 TaxID=3133325 RepID=UPI003F629CA4